MKRFHCSCGAEIFFDNTKCLNCEQDLGFDPATLRMFTIQNAKDGFVTEAGESGPRFRLCEHRPENVLSCNWLIAEDDSHDECVSCRLTRMIPHLSIPKNVKRWRILEDAKKRMIYNLLNNRLTFETREENPEQGLVFDFLEDRRSNPLVSEEHIYTGHNSGVITINAAEADPEYRVAVREEMNERYRTNLGHFRHEIGHYYWMRLIQNTRWEPEFTTIFGDPYWDYDISLKNYYENGPRADWQEYHISAYASMHPLEDWAETWAHYLHMNDALETAVSFNVLKLEFRRDNFRQIFAKWMELAVAMNALNRSVGKFDAYPFVIKHMVYRKLEFIRRVVTEARESAAPAVFSAFGSSGGSIN